MRLSIFYLKLRKKKKSKSMNEWDENKITSFFNIFKIFLKFLINSFLVRIKKY